MALPLLCATVRHIASAARKFVQRLCVANCFFSLPSSFIASSWEQLYMSTQGVCFLLEPSESCTIFLGGWLMSVLVVLIFKSPLFTYAVDASLLIFLLSLFFTCVTTLCHKWLFLSFLLCSSCQPLVIACYKSVSLLFERECVDLFYE